MDVMRSHGVLSLSFGGALLACALAACRVDDVAESGEDDVEFRVGPTLPSSMATSNATLQATATAGRAFAPGRLREVATDYAARYHGLAADAAPLGITFLNDADGNVTAMSVTYARTSDVSHPTAASLQTWINTQSAAIETAIAADNALPLRAIAELRAPSEYLNVIVGATPRQPRLLSMTPGLPLQVYEQLGRRRIAEALDVPLANVGAGTAFFEPALDPTARMGLRYQVNGKGAQLYFVPTGAQPLGQVVSAATFGEARTTALATYKSALSTSLGLPPATGLGALLETKHARQWGRTFALMDAQWGAARPLACSNCSAQSNTLYEAGVRDFHDQMFLDTNDECDCVETDFDGSTRVVNDCDLADRCCELEDGEFPDTTDIDECLRECECECEAQEWDTVYYDHVLRGVPNLFQHSVDIGFVPWCSDWVAVGCGPIAAAELAVWYDNLGHDGMLDHHHDTNGKFLWQDLAEELRDDYLDVTCLGGATATTNENLAEGTFDFFWDRGVPVAVVHDVVEVDEELDAWSTIGDHIEQEQPLILGFNANSVPLGQGIMNHFALITGHSTTIGTREIHLNMGWGLSSQEVREWDLVGQVHLITVDVQPTPTGNEECMADTSLSTLFSPSSSLEWSASWSNYDDYPVVEHLTGTTAPDCDRLGGATQGWFDVHWTEHVECITPHALDVLEQSYQEFEEELNDTSPPEWIWE
jgi:hypothetical protein